MGTCSNSFLSTVSLLCCFHWSFLSLLLVISIKTQIRFFWCLSLGFQKLVENQLNSKIKLFRSDGGGEFSSTVFHDHLRLHGIRHQASCPATPEQNGVAERKHRHIVELGLALLFEAFMPRSYWVEAFTTVNFLINRLSSASLQMHSLYFLM